MASPLGVLVSTARSMATRAQPSRVERSMRAVKSTIERDSRSTFATISAAAWLERRASSAARMPGRRRSRPEKPGILHDVEQLPASPCSLRFDSIPLGDQTGA